MDAKKFIESLSDFEKKEVLNVLCKHYEIKLNECFTNITVGDFLKKHGDLMSVRLYNVLQCVQSDFICDFSKWSFFKQIKGSGLKTWDEFYQLYYVTLNLK